MKHPCIEFDCPGVPARCPTSEQAKCQKVQAYVPTDEFASAAVAMSAHAVSVGIDTERIMSESQVRRVGRELRFACLAKI